ncbi:RIO1 family regulatory kinase/ATPase [Intrasporangium sp.]|uniref:serine protein kinase RIO n=1 Tax=Intrasporangium sp. TaxID=1925024 RepID=UPI0032221810
MSGKTSQPHDETLATLTRPSCSLDTEPDAAPEGERWSTWDGATHGPAPRPEWVITDLGAVESDLGVLKTGKEADVHLVRRWVPGDADRDVLMAAKRYRPPDRRLFHRDAGYLEGRRVRRSREMRAMRTRTDFGKALIGQMWAGTEFDTLATLWGEGLPVPYPVQLGESELLMEFIGDPDGTAAPRLVQTRPSVGLLGELFEQLRSAMTRLAELGWAHGDLSPYNVLLHHGRLVVIDWPQVVDVVGNPHGFDYLERDARNMADWFTRRGLPVDAAELFGDLAAAAAGASRW